MEGLPPVDWEELFSLPKDYWTADAEEVRKFMEEQVGARVTCERLLLAVGRVLFKLCLVDRAEILHRRTHMWTR